MTRRILSLGALCALLALPLAAQQPAAAAASRAPAPSRPAPPEGFLNVGTVSTAAETPLNFDYSISPFQLVSASLRFSDDGTKQKLNFSPLKLRGRRREWDGLTLNAVNGGGSSTFGLGLSYDQAAGYGGRFGKATAQFNERRLPPLDEICSKNDEIDTACADSVLLVDYERFWSGVMANSFVITAAGNLQTFSGLLASPVDLDGDDKIDNEHDIKAYEGSGTVLYRRSLRTSGSVTARYAYRRTSAVEGTELHPYYGVSVTGSTIVAILDRAYLRSSGFRSSLFIPSIALGMSLEYQHCNVVFTACEKQLKEQWVATPFMDVRLSGGTQFRLGLPIRRDRVGDKAGVNLEPLLQLGFTMAGL